MKINYVQSLSMDEVAGSTVIVPCLPDTNIESILNQISGNLATAAARVAKDFELSTEDVFTVFVSDVRIDLIRIKDSSYGLMRKALQAYAAKNGKRPPSAMHLYMMHIAEIDQSQMLAEGAVNGLLLGNYKPGLYKSDNSNGVVQNLFIHCDPAAQTAIERGVQSAETQKQILSLVNAPSNHKSPQSLADWAKDSGAKYGYSVKVLDEHALREQGFDALLAVNRGSEQPARFMICDYNPEIKGSKVVALVGKGVTFDTGGLSIKPSNHMHYMKSDMGGAAAVFGAVELAAKQQLPLRIIGFVPATDNSVDAKAIKPGDVIGSYAGQTIEVINTDAEGRLILADALSYAIRQYKPDVIIDLATLTGSVIGALGTHCAGLFTHNDDLALQLTEAGDSVGERLWRLPLWEDYAEDMRSDIADIKNLADKPMAGSITAAKFLEHFTDGHAVWAHLDIAGTAFTANGVSRNHTATAYGVRLLFEWLQTYAAKHVEQ